LFDTKDDFIQRIAPVGVAAIYFGSFTLSQRDLPLSRQALFKLSFLYNHFLHPGGLRIDVNRQTANISGTIASRPLATMAEILALQIDGIRAVQDQTRPAAGLTEKDATRETIQALLATDQTLRNGVKATLTDGLILLEGEVGTPAQKSWAESLVEAAVGPVESRIHIREDLDALPPAEPITMDDESLQALILFRLRLTRETEHLPLRVKANRGVVAVQGKVRTEALRQRVENIARSTVGLRELRSSLSISA
jgi:osmotically-inducible protein OsmY